MITQKDWLKILAGMGVKTLTAARWASAFEAEVQFEKFSKGRKDVLDWLPQILHECGKLDALQENLNYSAEGLVKTWPTRFSSVEFARPYAKNPQKIANKVYASRMGNGDESTGQGWEFRGRCPIMLTGKDGYIHVGNLMGQDLVVLPHLIEGPLYGLEAARRWWEGEIPDSMLGDTVRLRKKVNGGLIGIDEVVHLTEKLATLI